MKSFNSSARRRSAGLLVLLFILAAPIARGASSGKFSSLFEGDYDPEAALKQKGYSVDAGPRGNQTRNPQADYAWQSWMGVMTVPKEGGGGEAAAVILRDALNKALNNSCQDELTQPSGRPPGEAISGLLRYNKDGMHGDAHVWLIPGAAAGTISYVVFLREEKLK